MKLKDKLIIAFITMVALPIMLICLTATTIVRFQMNSLQQSYDIETKTLQVITNPIQILNRLTRGVYNEIKFNALRNPKRLEDETYYKQVNEKLQSNYSFLVVRKGKEYIYAGKEEQLKVVKSVLPKYGSGNTDVDGGIYLGGKNSFLVKNQDFIFSDGAEGTIFVITDLNILMPQLKAMAIQGIISFITIILLTACILLFWIYRSILRPLTILRVATNQIKEGDLSYSIEVEAEDEIGELCEDFEEMRIRLKKLIEDRLIYEKDMKELISNISHDLKTPLTAIKGYSEGVIDGVADTPEKQEKYLRIILSKATEMSVLVDELAYYAKIDNNTIPYSFKELNLNEYFADCMEDIQMDLEFKNIEVIFDNQVDPSTKIIADPEQLRRVIYNIITNSVKYMDKEKGVVRIQLCDLGRMVEINIEDNGSGIPGKDLPFIFDRFYRADVSRGTKKGGSGIGLAIAKKVIEDHSGKIYASSEFGVGTSICFTLQKKEL